ncbi:MAG: hypothetical protein ACFFFO_16820 [Candidatus Thorarchaeota archaeon]
MQTDQKINVVAMYPNLADIPKALYSKLEQRRNHGPVAKPGIATVHSELLWCVEALNLLVGGI